MTGYTNVLRFRRKRRRRSKNDMPVQMFAFPTSRHVKIIEFISREMREQPSLDAAEERLTDHLWVEAGRLSELGVTDDEIERFCRDFARAAWKIALRGSADDMGAA